MERIIINNEQLILNGTLKRGVLFRTPKDIEDGNFYAVIENGRVYKDGDLVNHNRKKELSKKEKKIFDMYGYLPKDKKQVERASETIKKWELGQKFSSKNGEDNLQ